MLSTVPTGSMARADVFGLERREWVLWYSPVVVLGVPWGVDDTGGRSLQQQNGPGMEKGLGWCSL